MTTLLMVTRRTAFWLPSQNFMALEERQPAVGYSHYFPRAARPDVRQVQAMASSPVSMVQLEMCTSWQPSGSMPSAHTASFWLE